MNNYFKFFFFFYINLLNQIFFAIILTPLTQSQLSHRQTCSRDELQKKWNGVCLPTDLLNTLLSLGRFGSDVDWMSFFALGCSTLGGVRRHFKQFFFFLSFNLPVKRRRSGDPKATLSVHHNIFTEGVRSPVVQ